MDAYIDDLTLSVTADTEEEAEELLVAAAIDLNRLIHEELRCKVALEKSVVISSSDGLANRLASRLTCVGATPAKSAVNLGVDFTCGRKRSAHAVSGARKGRMTKALARRQRLRSLRQTIGGKKTAKVAASGVLKAADYGAAVNGVSDSELLNLQRVGLAGATPNASGRSRTALLAINGDVTWQANAAPLLQWLRMSWRAKQAPKEGLASGELEEAWTDSTDERWGLIGDDGTRRWSQVRGPVGALYLTLDRIGWSTMDGVFFTDDLGITRHATEFTTESWKKFIQLSIQRGHEAELGLNTGCAELRGKRVCVDFVKRVIKSCRTSKEGARLLLANACNAVWSRTRALDAGYDLAST